jgi:hypothetical protein
VLKMCGAVVLSYFKNVFFLADMIELVSYLFTRLNDDLMSLTVTVFHRIWLRRNKLIF